MLKKTLAAVAILSVFVPTELFATPVPISDQLAIHDFKKEDHKLTYGPHGQVMGDLICIDFSDPQFSSLDGQQSGNFSAGGVDFLIEANSVLPNPFLTHDSGDGLGIHSAIQLGESDEVDTFEDLVLSSLSGPVFLESLIISNLFMNEANIFQDVYDERGTFSINGGPAQEFIAQNPDGSLTVPVGAFMDSVSLSGVFVALQGHDFSLQGIKFRSEVPEPGTLLLLGAGVVGYRRFRRREEEAAA